MASLGMRRGFLVGDGALRRKNEKNKAGKKQTKPTQKRKKKPEWDDTVTDLNVYKPSQDELRRRHEAHKSRNAGWTREMQSMENLTSPADSVVKRKQAILQEILFGQDNTVLSETDTTMSAVKDLFGDDPKKFFGFPNVTAAPKSDKNSESIDILNSRYMAGPVPEMLDSPTQLSMLSESIMRTPALNELSDKEDSESPGSDDHLQKDARKDEPQRTIFQPQLDLQRYRQLISNESNKETYKDMEDGHLHDGIAQNQKLHSYPEKDDKELTSPTINNGIPSIVKDSSCIPNGERIDLAQQKSTGSPSVPEQVPSNKREIQSKGATDSIEKEKAKLQRQSKTNTSTSSSNSSLRSLEDLRKMVESLEDEIAEYEMQTGRQPTTTTPQSKNFSGYTSSLIMAVTKLMKYLKEAEMQRNAEAILRDQILQGFSEQRELIDALTNDIVQTQEQNMKLQRELHSYRQNTDSQLTYLKRELEFVLKSFEYQTVQSTIQMLHSTRTVSLDALSESHQHTAQVSQRKTGAGQDCQMTQGAFIPVSAPREALLNDQQLNNRETDEAQGTRKQREDHGELMITACTRSGPKEAPVGIPGTVHSYVVPVTALAHHGTVQPQQVVMPAPIGTAVNTQNERTSLNTQQPDPPSESMLQQTRSKNGSSTVNQDLSNEESLVKSLIKDPLVTRDLRSRLQGIALKQRTTAAMRTTNSTAEDWKTNHVQGEKLHHASSHVHFRLPQDNTTSKPSINQRTDSGLPQKSPCISPIPPPDSTATDAPKVQINGLRKEKHVVVNLPSVWSDISLSTISV